jgi:hypothetical protein
MLWHGIYLKGHEACRLYQIENQWCLEGTAVSHEGRPCGLSYFVVSDLGLEHSERGGFGMARQR